MKVYDTSIHLIALLARPFFHLLGPAICMLLAIENSACTQLTIDKLHLYQNSKNCVFHLEDVLF